MFAATVLAVLRQSRKGDELALGYRVEHAGALVMGSPTFSPQVRARLRREPVGNRNVAAKTDQNVGRTDPSSHLRLRKDALS